MLYSCAHLIAAVQARIVLCVLTISFCSMHIVIALCVRAAPAFSPILDPKGTVTFNLGMLCTAKNKTENNWVTSDNGRGQSILQYYTILVKVLLNPKMNLV